MKTLVVITALLLATSADFVRGQSAGGSAGQGAVQDWRVRGLVAGLSDRRSRVAAWASIRGSDTLNLLTESDKTRLIASLLKDLDDISSDVRSAVAQALGRLGAMEAVPALLKRLDDEEPRVRSSVAQALGQLGAKEAVPGLLKRLDDNDLDVRSAAVQALGQLGVKEAVPALLKRLDDEESRVRSVVAQALGQLGAKEAVPGLLKRLDDKDSDIRAAAAQALGQLGAKEAVPALLKKLGDEDSDVRSAAVQALGQLGAKEAVPALLKQLSDEDSDVRSAAVQALGQLGAKEAVPALLKRLDDEDQDVRSAAARVLGRGAKETVPALLKRLDDKDSDIRAAAVQALGQLGAKEAVPALLKRLDDKDSDVRAAAVQALGQLGAKEAVPALLKRLGDKSSRVRSAVAQALGRLGAKEAMPALVKLLNDADFRVRLAVAQALGQLGPVKFGAGAEFIFPLLTRTYGHEDEVGKLLLSAHLMGGGEQDMETVVCCLGRNAAESCELTSTSSEEATRYLRVFRQAWGLSEPFPDLRKDLADKIAVLAGSRTWPSENFEDLVYLQQQLATLGSTYAADAKSVQDTINVHERFGWLARFGYGWAFQGVVWVALIFCYPRSSKVQAIFFWNPWVRRIVGFGYVGVLLTWVPFLRNRLLAPFRDSLLADADLRSFDPEAYFADSSVVLKPNGGAEPIGRAISKIAGQIVLEGESGLGKTMFLRHLAQGAMGPTVYLLAQRCQGGVIEAIQEKLHGYAQDKNFLQSLVYSGAIDVAIDGLNEVSPDTRAKVSSFMEHYFKGNVIVGTQPLEWTPPKTAKIYVLQPLTQSQIEAFLLMRGSHLPDDAILRGGEYERACTSYVGHLFGSPSSGRATESTLRMLSNPMDLTVVAAMLAHKEEPDLFHLREQQYRIMAADYKRTNVDRDFPLKSFSEHCYQLRLDDQVAISEQQFQIEILCMERHKLVVQRQSTGPDGKVETQWLFRHDKIMEFFIAQTFLGPGNERPQQHLSDARFRGVYLLLATFLPLDAAKALKERLIDYASDTKDHTVSDAFVQLVRPRLAA